MSSSHKSTGSSPSLSSKSATRARTREHTTASAQKKVHDHKGHKSKGDWESSQALLSAAPNPTSRGIGDSTLPHPASNDRSPNRTLQIRMGGLPYPHTISQSQYNSTQVISNATLQEDGAYDNLEKPYFPRSYNSVESIERLRTTRSERPKKVRPRVKLYRDPADDLGTDKDFAEGNEEGSTEPQDEAAFDTPYIPGASSENKIRCLQWLRNVPKDTEGYGKQE